MLSILEIKRTSITRLKHKIRIWCPCHDFILKSKEPRLRDWNSTSNTQRGGIDTTWNQKNLDYEIETNVKKIACLTAVKLEIKRTSITRLKQNHATRKWTRSQLEIKRTSITRLKRAEKPSWQAAAWPWNQKNLDYEIETNEMRSTVQLEMFSWNQKNLDYEIETL